MQFNLGDFVRFVDENIEGYITRIIDKDTIGVTDANDFEIPVLATKVTLVHGDIPENDIVSNKPAVVVPEKEFIKEGIYLGLVTDQHSSSVAHFHLVNESSFQLLLSLSTENLLTTRLRGDTSGLIDTVKARLEIEGLAANV